MYSFLNSKKQQQSVDSRHDLLKNINILIIYVKKRKNVKHIKTLKKSKSTQNKILEFGHHLVHLFFLNFIIQKINKNKRRWQWPTPGVNKHPQPHSS